MRIILGEKNVAVGLWGGQNYYFAEGEATGVQTPLWNE